MATNAMDKPLCSICLNVQRQPKIIDCHHSFCFSCLEDYINKVSTNNQFPCPLCRNIVNIPVGGVTQFESDLNVPQDLVSSITCKTEIPPCDACKTGVNSEFRCENCEQYLCNPCRTTHDGLKVCQGHLVVGVNSEFETPRGDNPKSASKDICPNHPEKEVRCYCKDCSLSVCLECFVIGHNGHKFLDLQDEKIKVETREKLKQLKMYLAARIDEFYKYTNSLKASVADIESCAEKSCKAVDTQVEKICSEVKQIGEDVKIKIHKSQDDERSKLTKPLKEMEMLIEDLKASVKCTVDVIEDTSIVQVLNRIPQVDKEQEECKLKKLDIPVVDYTWFEASLIDKTKLVEQLGTLLYQYTFTSTFNVDDENLQLGKEVYTDALYIQGLAWRFLVRKSKKSPPSLGLFIQLKDEGHRLDVKSCQATITFKLLNVKHMKQSTEKTSSNTFNPGTDWGWSEFVNWNNILANKEVGFLDDNNNFTIQASVRVINIERG
ncbi:tripartite motif-containing protein 45 [Patella vulgata]|uniref:tripartite motif-containing protein 45 n=1 Tax=Patella vulgata TaxID=6465 RepID=UPI00217F3DB7|nr:tripartite motif-containing protein 45 [Patella vulgata]